MSKILTVKQAAQEFFGGTVSQEMIYVLVRDLSRILCLIKVT
ncbi:MAG: hypothetical protein PWQ34_908 [Caldanaerobacter sp.]|nr:hypothetical protein [Caldanaerobacter sp.]